MTYIVLRVDSPTEAARLVEDVRENPREDLSTPHWGNRVHAVVAGVLEQLPAELAQLGGAA